MFLCIASIKPCSFYEYPDLTRKFETNILCPICLNKDDNSLFVETNCQNNEAHHAFHAQCLQKMFKDFNIATCPLCRWDLAEISKDHPLKQIIPVMAISYKNLIMNCMKGNLKTLHRFANYGLDIDFQEDSINIFSQEPPLNYAGIYQYLLNLQKCTPLIVAAAFNQWHIVKYLLKRGADISQPYGYKCLAMAIEEQQIEIIELIVLKKTMDLNRKSSKGNTFLIYAINTDNIDIIKLLLDNGANIDLATEPNGDTPYIFAVKNRKINATKYLFEHGADITIKNKDGKSVFDINFDISIH